MRNPVKPCIRRRVKNDPHTPFSPSWGAWRKQLGVYLPFRVMRCFRPRALVQAHGARQRRVKAIRREKV